MGTIDTIKTETICSEIPNKSDTISRQEAIDAFDGVKVDEEYCTEYDIGYNDGIDFAVSKISALPSAQPKPKTGHWIWCVGSHKCSNCEEYTCFNHKELLRYCPNCGAKMEEEDGKSGCNHPVGEDKDPDHE